VIFRRERQARFFKSDKASNYLSAVVLFFFLSLVCVRLSCFLISMNNYGAFICLVVCGVVLKPAQLPEESIG
jgi:hypothetical protein